MSGARVAVPRRGGGGGVRVRVRKPPTSRCRAENNVGSAGVPQNDARGDGVSRDASVRPGRPAIVSSLATSAARVRAPASPETVPDERARRCRRCGRRARVLDDVGTHGRLQWFRRARRAGAVPRQGPRVRGRGEPRDRGRGRPGSGPSKQDAHRRGRQGVPLRRRGGARALRPPRARAEAPARAGEVRQGSGSSSRNARRRSRRSPDGNAGRNLRVRALARDSSRLHDPGGDAPAAVAPRAPRGVP